jgi:hypothetical protein
MSGYVKFSGTEPLRNSETACVIIRAVESDSESEGILGGVGVGKNVRTLTPASI